jgi:hypothetical protein
MFFDSVPACGLPLACQQRKNKGRRKNGKSSDARTICYDEREYPRQNKSAAGKRVL